MSAKNQSTREKAAAARAAANASERRRENIMRFSIGAVVLLVVVGIIGAALWTTNKSSTVAAGDTVLPTGVSEPEFGAAVGPEGVPVLDVYEDFQCPACVATEQRLGATIAELVASGQVRVVYHPMNFLDRNLGNTSSTDATAAFGCAVDAGKTLEYHNTVFTNAPETEGTGYTIDQLKSFGPLAGIEGDALTTFDACVTAGTYNGWGNLSNEAASNKGVTATPTYFLNGEKLDNTALASGDALRAAVAAAVSGQ